MLKINLPELVEIYSLANTPNFIFNKYRSNPSVHALSKSHSTEQLILELRSLMSLDKLSIEEATLAYVILVSLSFKGNWHQIKQEFVSIDLNRLRWASYILGLIDSVITSSTKVKFDYKQTLPEKAKISSEINNQRFTFNP